MARKDYDKKTVTCYLPSYLEKQVQAYCTEHELTRKAKDEDGNETIEPRWGTGIVKILEDYFNSQVQSTVQDNVQGTVQTQVQSDVQSTVQSTVQDETREAKSQKAPTLEKRVEILEAELESLQEDTLTRQEFHGWASPLPQYIAQTEETTTTQNNETPTSEESGGIETQQREHGEAPLSQIEGKFGQHSTDSTDNALTEETDHGESLTTEEAEGSEIAPPEECQTYLIKVKNNSKPIELIRGIDFSPDTDDDVMEAVETYIFENDLADPDDQDINIAIVDDPTAWKKANKGKGISLDAMGKKIEGISRNTIEKCMNGEGSQDKQAIYESKITPHFYWCFLTKKFYRR